MNSKLKQDDTKDFIKQFGRLTTLKIKLYYKKISTIVLFSLVLFVTLIIDIAGILLIKNTKDYDDLLQQINMLIVALTILIFVITIYLTIKIFKDELTNNIHTLELRYGYKPKAIFMSRILNSLTLILSLYLIILVINLSFGLPKNQLFSVVGYKLYISSLSWYFIAMLIAYTLTILFSVFFSSIWSLLSVMLVFMIILLGVFAGGNFASSGFYSLPNTSGVNLNQELKKERQFEFVKGLNKIDSEIVSNSLYFESELKNDDLNSYFINKQNLVYFGPKGWKNWDALKANLKYKSIVDLYNYFETYFSENEFNYGYSNIVGLSNDFEQTKVEPLVSLLTAMEKTVDIKYQGLINNLLRFNKDLKALRSLGINYDWIADRYDQNNALKRINDFIESNKFNPTEILFYKLLGKNLSESSIGITINPNNSLHTKNQFEIIETEDKLSYKENLEKYIQIQKRNIIFNPLVQISVLFNSVNYINFDIDNIINAQNEIFGNTLNFTYFGDMSPEDYGYNVNSFKRQRIIYPELIYVAYFGISCLVIFGAFFKFKKNLKNNK